MRRTTIITVIVLLLASLAPSHSAYQKLMQRVWTNDGDFSLGSLNRVTHDPNHHQLELTQSTAPKPYIWVPCNDGTIAKLSISTGSLLGRYRVAPEGSNSNGSPSRTTVDQNGNCWVGCRSIGTVVKVGLQENGPGIGWVDRNGNGICDTSSAGSVLPFGSDECVLFEVVLNPGLEGTYTPGAVPWSKYSNSGPRSLVIDRENNLWVGCNSNGMFYNIDSDTGRFIRQFQIPGHSAYGAVMDRNGIIWSSGYGGSVVRIDTSVDPVVHASINATGYGVGLDKLGHLFTAHYGEGIFSKWDINTNPATWLGEWGDYAIPGGRGIACDNNHNVWIAASGSTQALEYTNDGDFVRAVELGASPYGVAKDADGNMWAVSNQETNGVAKIDPTTGAVLFQRTIPGSGGHYGYSDMCGTVVWDNTWRTGTWTATWDTGIDASWGVLGWDDYVPNTNNCWLTVKVRSSNDQVNWSDWERAYKDADLQNTPDGRYLQVRVTMHSDHPTITPILYQITAWHVNSFLVNPRNVNVPEGGANTFQVKLKGSPGTTITAGIQKVTGGDPDLYLNSSSALTFSNANWNSWQTVTLRANEDPDSHNGGATFRLSQAQLRPQNVAAAEVDNDAPSYVLNWGTYGPGAGQFDHPMDVCSDPLGYIYVADTQNHRIQKFTSTGQYVMAWGSRGTGVAQFEQPCGVCSDSKGNIFVADTYNDRIQIFRGNGSYAGMITGLNLPWGVASGPQDHIYVADTYNHTIRRYYPQDTNSDGLYDQWDSWSSFGGEGSEDGKLRYPEGVTVDAAGHVYVVDTYNNRISKFDNYGTFKTSFGNYGATGDRFRYPKGAAIDPYTGDLYVSNTYNHMIDLWFNGAFQSSWGSYGTANGQFARPGGIGCDRSGGVYVADTSNNRVQKFFRQPINLRDLPDGTPVAFGPVTVTAVFDPQPVDYRVYVENGDRTFGIRCDTDNICGYDWYCLEANHTVNVSGILSTDLSTGERYIDCDPYYPQYLADGTAVGPLGMRNEWLRTSSESHYVIGMEGAPFYSAGLLVHSWGKVMYTNPAGGYFTIRDGSRILHYDGVNYDKTEELYIPVILPPNTTMPTAGQYLKVTGISTRMTGSQFALRPRSSTDMAEVSSWTAGGIALSVGQNFLSLPGIPYDCNPESVWMGCSGGPGIPLPWNLKRFHPERQRWYWYTECEGFGNGIMGEGYGLTIAPGGNTCYSYLRDAVPSDKDEIIFLPKGSNPIGSFSLIGNPYPNNMRWSQFVVADGVKTKTLGEAITDGWIWKVQSWNGSDWVDLNVASGTMEATKAYKVFPKRSKLAMIIPAWAIDER